MRGALFGLVSIIGLLCILSRTSGEAAAALRVPTGFQIVRIASVPGARELAAAPNGDLFVGTSGSDVYIIPHADANRAGNPQVFVHITDAPAAGVTIANGDLFIGSQFGVWRLPYRAGELHASDSAEKIASVRLSGVSRDHVTTTVAFTNGKLYASVGSSCNVCDPELDATRATIQQMDTNGKGFGPRAIHIRNAIALAVNPATGSLWAGVAGQDELAAGHPYEIFDPVTLHSGVPDYGWPYCYENRRATSPGRRCSNVVVPRVIFPAYDTPIGATFYPPNPRGRHVFPRAYWGGAFVTMHGSWHQPPVPPRVTFVPMHGDTPQRRIDWNNPNTQWSEFIGNFQTASGDRVGRPTGIAIGPQGDLFVADDAADAI
ncbi:MAG: hypothetical protein JO233_08135, partial [Candidatus Eremiobacteraeota bacterium]|nr:hypothetical protein [Candidatus Eremiobacteraeota bacterium]